MMLKKDEIMEIDMQIARLQCEADDLREEMHYQEVLSMQFDNICGFEGKTKADKEFSKAFDEYMNVIKIKEWLEALKGENDLLERIKGICEECFSPEVKGNPMNDKFILFHRAQALAIIYQAILSNGANLLPLNEEKQDDQITIEEDGI